MCYECYKEAGSPTIVNENTKRAAKLIKEIYNNDDCCVGGYAHIVVDDWNLDDEDIDFCIIESIKGDYEISETGRKSCLTCLEFLRGISEKERYSAMAIHRGFIQIR